MIRQNDRIVDQLIGGGGQGGRVADDDDGDDDSDREGGCPTSSMESYLIGLRLQLWPLFQKEMGSNIESVRKLAETGTASGGMAGVLGVRNAIVKDSVVATVSGSWGKKRGEGVKDADPAKGKDRAVVDEIR